MQSPVSQQDFLKNAMSELGMNRDQFAKRIGASKRRLDNWLLPTNSKGFREMDSVVWAFVREILAHRKKI